MKNCRVTISSKGETKTLVMPGIELLNRLHWDSFSERLCLNYDVHSWEVIEVEYPVDQEPS